MQEERGITRRLQEGGEREEGWRADEKSDVVNQGFSGKEVDAAGRRAEEEMKRRLNIGGD